MRKSEAEEVFLLAWYESGLDRAVPETEYRFHPHRRWRFDVAWPTAKVALEIEGRGRHQTVTGFRNDCEKYNAALALHWRVLRYPASDVKRDPVAVVEEVARVLCGVELDA